MASDKQVKDKRITLKGSVYLATVEYFRDKPARDCHTEVTELCDGDNGMQDAQKFLAGFPRDIWDGQSHVGAKKPLM